MIVGTPASCRLKRRGGPRELLLDDRPVEQGCDDTERYCRRSSDTQTDGESKETAPNGSPAEVMGRSPADCSPCLVGPPASPF